MKHYQFDLFDIHFGNQRIIDRCQLDVTRGKTIALIGPSGCGKSTLLNTIAGLIRFDHLTLPQGLNLGYIFQESRLIPWLTVAENLTLINPHLTETDVVTRLEDVRLSGIASKYPSELSGGMQKRVSIARCFVNDPELILMDEPFSSLDAPTADHLTSLVASLMSNKGSACILVTHNLKEALKLADVIYFLSTKPTRIIKVFENPLAQQEQMRSELSPAIDLVLNTILMEHPCILSGSLVNI